MGAELADKLATHIFNHAAESLFACWNTAIIPALTASEAFWVLWCLSRQAVAFSDLSMCGFDVGLSLLETLTHAAGTNL